MRELKCKKYKNKVPVVRDVVLDEFATEILNDYNPNLLKEARAIDYQEIAEFYIGADIQFLDIYYKKDQSPIFGVASFNNGDQLSVFDKEHLCIKKIELSRNTIVLDSSLEGKNEVQNFTGFHECAHLMLHRQYFERNGQMNLFSYIDKFNESDIVCCRQADLCNGKSQLITAHDFMEHQANFLAAAMAIPKETLVPYIQSWFLSHGISNGILYVSNPADEILMETLEREVARVYKMSKTCVHIRLKKLGFIQYIEGYQEFKYMG